MQREKSIIVLGGFIAGMLFAAGEPGWADGKFSGGAGDGYAMQETTNSLGGTGVSLSAAANQTFTRGTSSQAAGTLTITDGAPAAIKAGGDIRVTIPAGTYMTWVTSVTTPTFGGSGAGKVNGTVSYENADKTVVINVTSDFANNDTLTIAGLAFTNILGACRPASLELDIHNDGKADAFDDKTVAVTVLRPGGPGDGWDMRAMTNDVSLTPLPKGTIISICEADPDYVPRTALPNPVQPLAVMWTLAAPNPAYRPLN